VSQSREPALKRRRLFAGAGTLAAAAAGAAVLPLVKPADAAAPDPKPAPDKGGGYQLSEHVLRYYQTTKV